MAVNKTLLKNSFIKIFIEVDNCVLELAPAVSTVALTASFMVMHFLGSSHSEVTHVLFAALHTDFKVSVTVDFTQFLWGNSALTM